VDSINKCSIKGPAILPLQRILLISAVYNIHIPPFWVPSEENMVADAASHYDYNTLANLGLQVSRFPKPAELRRKLNSFFTTPSHQALGGATIRSPGNTFHSVTSTTTIPTHRPFELRPTGSLISCTPSNPQLHKDTSAPSDPFIFKQGLARWELTTIKRFEKVSPVHDFTI
jgi:hypothetical protein